MGNNKNIRSQIIFIFFISFIYCRPILCMTKSPRRSKAFKYDQLKVQTENLVLIMAVINQKNIANIINKSQKASPAITGTIKLILEPEKHITEKAKLIPEPKKPQKEPEKNTLYKNKKLSSDSDIFGLNCKTKSVEELYYPELDQEEPWESPTDKYGGSTPDIPKYMKK